MTSQFSQLIFMLVVGYLVGSIPTAYLAGKWIKGIDLREFGSGTVSASMVWEHVAKWALFPVGIFDILKGAIPVWISLALNFPIQNAALVGLFAVLGHNWPIYLKFHGGRGLSPFLGILFVLFPYGFLLMVIALGIGFVLDISAPLILIILGVLPVLSDHLNGPSVALFLSLGMLVITAIKRLEANQRPFPKEKKACLRVIFFRLFFDRDIMDHQAWLHRSPANQTPDKDDKETCS